MTPKWVTRAGPTQSCETEAGRLSLLTVVAIVTKCVCVTASDYRRALGA